MWRRISKASLRVKSVIKEGLSGLQEALENGDLSIRPDLAITVLPPMSKSTPGKPKEKQKPSSAPMGLKKVTRVGIASLKGVPIGKQLAIAELYPMLGVSAIARALRLNRETVRTILFTDARAKHREIDRHLQHQKKGYKPRLNCEYCK